MNKRIPGFQPSRSRAALQNGQAYIVSTASDTSQSMYGQTRQALDALNADLAALGLRRVPVVLPPLQEAAFAEGQREELEKAGHSVVAIGNDDHVCGLISVADGLRDDAADRAALELRARYIQPRRPDRRPA